MITEELRREQGHVDRAYARLEVLRERARGLAEAVLDRRVASTHQARYERDVVVHASGLRLARLELGSLPLVFGRIDRTDGEHYHIGRVAVSDPERTPLVVDWRAPVAEPFYRATPREPLGLARRRHFRTRGQKLLGIDDEGFDGVGSDLPLVGEGALLSSLRRARTGRMTDIVATIQAEQDAVIRAPLDRSLVVQGGPGTGKTAVALHRAAYLLFTHRARLERQGVLLVGPTAAFLRYIEDVLPSLGEQQVRLATIAGLVGGCPVGATEPAPVARLKGEARIAAVLARAPLERSPARTVLALLSSPERIARAARGVLDEREQALLHRGEWQGWTAADLPLVDEVAARSPAFAGKPALGDEQRWELERFVDEVVASHPTDSVMAGDLLARLTEARLELEPAVEDGQPVYGHVLVDEAQDLSPMQWRMLRRRCPAGSMTIVGDLGQATGVWAHETWEQAVAALQGRVTVTQLTVNYRTPEEIARFADRLRPDSLAPGRPVRSGGAPPSVRHVAAGAVEAEVEAAVCEALVAVEGTVGVVAPDPLVLRIRDDRISVATVEDAKGIEFDAVVVADPGTIVRRHGSRALYVALTRATQRLTVVHTGDLPAALR
jgi:DNA helicase IV